MDATAAGKTQRGELVEAPDDPGLDPGVTLRSKQAGQWIYEIDLDQLPTETITRGGRRIVIDEGGALRERDPEAQPHYEVLEKISEGGMGLVYKVRETSLKREVALKICRTELKPEDRNPQEVREFTNEAFMTAHLDHPGVVPIYALAKDAEGRPFFAMKKVEGLRWKDLLHPEGLREPGQREVVQKRAEQMSLRDHFNVLLKVCDAVAYAHSKGILHRDLKPENIMLGDFGEVYVMDWGLAMYFDERSEYRRVPGLKPQLAGTPHYIAPEMVRGEMTALCPASDVYLLGGILYEILTGSPPHDGATIRELLQKVAEGEVPPPEEICGPDLIPAALSRIVMKALAPRLEDRYPTVLEFQREVREYMANSESIAVGYRAALMLVDIRRDLEGRAASRGEDDAIIFYGRLSECIGVYEQAIVLWKGNDEARRGLLDALALQIHLAIKQGDLTLARAQCRLLDTVKEEGAAADLIQQVGESRRELESLIETRQAQLQRAAWQALAWKIAAAVLAMLVLGGMAVALWLGVG